MIWKRTAVAAALAFALPFAAGHARADDIKKVCVGEYEGHVSIDDFLASCAVVIDSDSYGSDRVAALTNRSALYVRMGRYADAIEDCKKAQTLGRGPNALLALNCGRAYSGNGDFAHAVEEYTNAIAARPSFLEAYTRRAFAYKKLGSADLAVHDYKVASGLVALQPDDFRIRGFARGNLGDYDDAIEDLDRAIRLDPRNAPAFNGRCLFRARAGKELETALEDCTKSLSLSAINPTFDVRAFVYLRLGNYGAAVADETVALLRGDKDADPLYIRGLAHLKAGDKKSGDADIAAATAIDPKIAEAYAGYGVTP